MFDVAMRLRSLTQAHHSLWRSSQLFSRSSWMAHGRPGFTISAIHGKQSNGRGKGRNCHTELHVKFRHTQCLARRWEESPESVVGGFGSQLHVFGRHGLGQWVLRYTQLESWAGAVDSRDAASSVQVASTPPGDGSRGEARGLYGGSSHREMERWCQIGRRQFRHKAPISGQTSDGRPMHGGYWRRGRSWGCRSLFFSGSKESDHVGVWRQLEVVHF